MVQKNRNTMLPRSKNTVVEFGLLKIKESPPSTLINTKSEVTGVSYEKKDKTWRVFFQKNLQKVSLGSFKDKKMAEYVALNYSKSNQWGNVKALRASRPRAGCSSKYKGVCWVKRRSNWSSSMKTENKEVFIGHFAEETEAALAYDKKAIELWGDDAYTNQMAFPEDFT